MPRTTYGDELNPYPSGPNARTFVPKNTYRGTCSMNRTKLVATAGVIAGILGVTGCSATAQPVASHPTTTTTAARTATPAPTLTPHTSHTDTASPSSVSATPAAAATVTAPLAAAPPAVTPTPAVVTRALAPLAARQSAALVLQTADDQIRQDFETGASLSGNPQQSEWWASGASHGGDDFPVYVVKVSLHAFGTADKYFDAANEPSSITDWRNGGTLVQDLQTWHQSDVGYGEDPGLQKQVETDLDHLDSLVTAVEAGG